MARLITYAITRQPQVYNRDSKWGDRMVAKIAVSVSDMPDAVLFGGDTLIGKPWATARGIDLGVEWYNGYVGLRLGRAPLGDFPGEYDASRIDSDILRLLTQAHENGALDALDQF